MCQRQRVTYENTLKDHARASSNKSGKDKPVKEHNIQMKIKEKPKKRGHKKKSSDISSDSDSDSDMEGGAVIGNQIGMLNPLDSKTQKSH